MEPTTASGETIRLDAATRAWAAVAHLAPLLTSYPTFTLGGWVPPICCWFAFRKTRPFAAAHSLASLELRMTLTLFLGASLVVIAQLVDPRDEAGPIGFQALLGVFVFLGLCLVEGLCSLYGALQAAGGRPFRYPIALPLCGLYPWGRRTGFERWKPEA